MKKLYRYEIEYTSEDGGTNVYLKELPVFRETEYTYFVGQQYQTSQILGGKLRRVSKSKRALNAYAHSTSEAAKKHFIRRTETRIKWFRFWKEECERALDIIKIFDHK